MGKKTNKNKVKVKADYYFGDFETQANKLTDYYRNLEATKLAQIAAKYEDISPDLVREESMKIRYEINGLIEASHAKLAKRINNFYNN